MRLANSNNHDKDGQNILYGDGHVAWESNPFVGVNRDNIYTTADGKVIVTPDNFIRAESDVYMAAQLKVIGSDVENPKMQGAGMDRQKALEAARRRRALRMEQLDSGSAVPERLRGGIVALGNFDGFHKGHQAVVGRAITRARAEGRPALVATFDPHPVRFFNPDAPPFRLTTLDQRERLFAAAGADDSIDIAMFYLADRAVIEALLAAGHEVMIVPRRSSRHMPWPSSTGLPWMPCRRPARS